MSRYDSDMGKLGGLLAIATAALILSGCGGVGETAAVETSAPAGKIQPFAATAPSVSASPDVTADAGVTAEEQSAYLVGVKGAYDSWKNGTPDDATLVSRGLDACAKFAAGMEYQEIGALAGETEDAKNDGIAVAVYASRHLCTEYNTDKL